MGCALFVFGTLLLILVVTIAKAVFPDQRVVTSSEFGSRWPLTVPSGMLRCTLGVVTFEHGGITYAVNALAERTRSYEPIAPIIAGAPEKAASQSLDPLIDAGRDLCPH